MCEANACEAHMDVNFNLDDCELDTSLEHKCSVNIH